MLEIGPKLDWTRDNKIFDRYQLWKAKVEMIFSSALADCTPEQKTSYLRYWMGDQGIPLVKKWTTLGKLDFSNPTEGERDRPILSGFVLKNYWDLLEAEFKPKGNKLLSIIELWSQSKQGPKTLNEWLTYVYNIVELCDYGDSKDRIIRDVLIIGCNSDKAKDKIVRQGEKIKLQEVIEILQIEDSIIIIIIIIYLHIIFYKSCVLLIYTAIAMPCLLVPCYDMSVANEARRSVPNEVLLPCTNTYLYLIITEQTKRKPNYEYTQLLNHYRWLVQL